MKAEGPVPPLDRFVVLNGSSRAPNVGSWLSRFGLAQKAVANLHGPIVVRRKRKARRARVPRMRFKVVAILVRLAAIKDRAFQLEPTISESGGQDAKADVRRILQVMRECCRRIF